MAKKSQTLRAWRFVGQASKPTEREMSAVSSAFEPLVDKLQKALPPIPRPQQWNHCVDVFTKWKGSYFYLMQKHQCPPGNMPPGFDAGIARLEFTSPDTFNLAYLRHNDKWWTLLQGVSLADCLRAVEHDPWFQFM